MKIQSSEIIHLPAFPMAGNKLFASLGAAVGASRGGSLSNAAIERIMGSSESTVSYGFGGSNQPHLVASFSLLEHLTPDDRHRVVDKRCCELPFLDHP